MTQPVPSTPYGGAVVEPTPNEEVAEQHQDAPSGVVAPLVPMTGDSTGAPGRNLPTQPPAEPVSDPEVKSGEKAEGVQISASGTTQAPAPTTATSTAKPAQQANAKPAEQKPTEQKPAEQK